jgi:hypothetical protein
MDILIAAPPYTHKSGGIRVLHYLGFLAKCNGHKVKMASPHCNPEWGIYSQHINWPDITIIPEIHQPTKPSAGNVARWVLYFPGRICGGPTIYPEHEQVVSYHAEYDKAANAAATRKPIITFTLPFCDMPNLSPVPIPMDQREIGVAVWYGKGPRACSFESLGAIEITRNNPATRIELINLLQNTKIFFSFDKHTALNDEALLCGCKVFLWDVDDFKEYINPIASSIVMDIDRDTISVNNFLNQLADIFEI